MSAFVVSQNHIHTLATAAYDMELVEGKDLNAFGRMLWNENVSSIADRYCLSANSTELREYRETVKAYDFACVRAESVAHLKSAIDCFEYQSCEHAGWDMSAARFACELMLSRIGPVSKDDTTFEKVGWGID